jgi:hypothetical protein
VGLPLQAERLGVQPVEPQVEQILDTRGPQHLAAVPARRLHGGPDTQLPQDSDHVDRRGENLDLVPSQPPHEQRILALPQAVNGHGLRAVGRVSLEQLDTAGGQEAPHPLMAGLAVHVFEVIGVDIERWVRLAAGGLVACEELVERPLPGPRVQRRRLRDHAVHVEDDRVKLVSSHGRRRSVPGRRGRSGRRSE